MIALVDVIELILAVIAGLIVGSVIAEFVDRSGISRSQKI